MKIIHLSLQRLLAVMHKEFIQMKRDRLTFAMIVGIPLMQLILFGFAINTNPKHLPTAVLTTDYSEFTRQFIQGIKNTDYFSVTRNVTSEKEADQLLARANVQFAINIPSDFTKKLIRGEKPAILVTADATDPVATGFAISAIGTMMQYILNTTLSFGSLSYLQGTSPQTIAATARATNPQSITQSASVIIHAKYNPESITQYNVVPGLVGVVLTMTMILITSLAITRERERGTMENLLSTPVQPLEVMIGKITPYIIVGYIQVSLILVVAYFIFNVPIMGNLFLLLAAILPFIAANLAIGLTFSSIAKNQLQAMQMAFFFFLPSILLSGFIFPFRGMPTWAQYLGQALPLSHFLIIVRGIMLKGNVLSDIWEQLWPITLFMLVAISIGLKRFRKTLD